MTDERLGNGLWAAIAALPRDAGIVFRYYHTVPVERRRLFDAVRREARRRGLLLVLAGPLKDAIAWRADGAHGGFPHRRSGRLLLRTAPAHDRRELVAARRAGVDLRFVSPLFATRSHPGGWALGPVRAGLMIAGDRRGLIALGGMTTRRFAAVRSLGFEGWAAIDAWAAGAPS